MTSQASQPTPPGILVSSSYKTQHQNTPRQQTLTGPIERLDDEAMTMPVSRYPNQFPLPELMLSPSSNVRELKCLG